MQRALLVNLVVSLLALLSLMIFLVVRGETLSIEHQIMLLFRNPADLSDPVGPQWFEELMRDLTALGSTGILVLVTLWSAIYLFFHQHKRLALFVIVAIASGVLCSYLLKYGFARPRPDLVPHGSYVYTSSFPSGHSMLSALVYFTLTGLFARLHQSAKIKLFLYSASTVLVLLIGISRVYLGVHWPSDVLAGWSAGLLWALLCLQIARYIP